MRGDRGVHLYTLCWNDRRVLPHFFRHYTEIVDCFFIFDNGSTDGSLDVLAGDERVQVSPFESDADSFVATELRLSEEIWKSSRGVADWAIVVDLDEHLYHDDLRSYLQACARRGVTAIRTVGYEMLSQTFPGAGARLCDVVTTGVRMPELYDKLCIFNPAAIARTNYLPGRHVANPEGRVQWPAVDEVLLLHYKKLGLEYEIARSAELRTGLRSRDIEEQWGCQYLLSPKQITEAFNRLSERAEPVPRSAADLWEREFERLRQDAARLRDEVSVAHEHLSEQQAQTATLSAELASARQRLREIYRSRSWRTTQPLRSLHWTITAPLRSRRHRTARPVREAAAAAHSRAMDDDPAPPHAGVGPLSSSVGRPPTAALPATKDELECAMRSRPKDLALRQEYFALLEEISRSNLGGFYASLPEILTPIMLRAGTSDVWNLRQIFMDGEFGPGEYIYGDYAFRMPPLRRILDLGAYCGYTAVYFANRFPNAEIICVEPPGANFDVLRANTAPYSKIRCVAAAVWHERTSVQLSGQLLGDWGNQFSASDDATPADGVPAYTIADILAMHGWEGADFIKCLLVGAQVDVLASGDRSWLQRVLLVATKPPTGRWPRPDDEDRLFAAFSEDEFERIKNANAVLAFRRRSAADTGQPGAAEPLSLVPPMPQMRQINLTNIRDRFGFYKFGSGGISLTPNPPDAPAATLACRLELSGHDRFVARVQSGPSPSPDAAVTFTLTLRECVSGAVSVSERVAVPCPGERSWDVDFRPISGAHELTLSTEAAGTGLADGQLPAARVIDATLL